jgi:hypothetical protein
MVEVFRTNIDTDKNADFILKQLQAVFPDCKINFDLEDCDKILRIETQNGHINLCGITQIVNNFGYSADVLPDISETQTIKMNT